VGLHIESRGFHQNAHERSLTTQSMQNLYQLVKYIWTKEPALDTCQATSPCIRLYVNMTPHMTVEDRLLRKNCKLKRLNCWKKWLLSSKQVSGIS